MTIRGRFLYSKTLFFQNRYKFSKHVRMCSYQKMGNKNPQLDSFTTEFTKNHINTTPLQNSILKIGSAIMSLADPHRHDMIACLGETTGTEALTNILHRMKKCPEGSAILNDKPRINTKTVDLELLRKLPEDSFGRVYLKFLENNKVTPDTRLGVRFLDDIELGFVMQRYRESHDLYHALLGMPTHMLGEVSVKWVEALNNELPMCIAGALFGALRLRPKQRMLYKKYYLPWALKVGQQMPLLMCIYWEKRWEQPIYDLRRELNVELLQSPDLC